MARTPEELMDKLSSDRKKLVDMLEATVDKQLDLSFCGPSIKIRIFAEIKTWAFDELKRRYPSWDVNLVGCGSNQEERWTDLRFTPEGTPHGIGGIKRA